MSDLCMYQLEDIAWDEFDQSDDHIVPRPSDEHANSHLLKGDSHKKPRLEVIDFSNSAVHDYAAKSACLEKEDIAFSTLTNGMNQMLENDSCSGSPASCNSDFMKDRMSLESDNTMTSSQCFKTSNMNSIGHEFCVDDPILSGKFAAADSNSYNYPLSHISQSGDDLGFFNDNHEGKESSDLLYFGWPDIGNFDDVDRIFSCDSTFGLDAAGNEGELGWFSSSNAIERSEDCLKPDIKFSCPESSGMKNLFENHESVRPNDIGCSTTDFIIKNGSAACKESSTQLEDSESVTFTHLSFLNGSSRESDSKDEVMHKQQVSLTKQHSQQQNPSEGEQKEQHLKNGSPFHYPVNIQNKDAKHPSQNLTGQVFNSVGFQLQKQCSGHDSFGFFKGNDSYNGQSSEDIAVSPTLSSIKSESNGQESIWTKESSYASNPVHSTENSCDLSFRVNVSALNEKRGKPGGHQAIQQTFSSNPQQVNLAAQASSCDPVSIQKQAHYDGHKFENHSDVEGVSVEVPGDLDSSNAQERSSMTSGLDENSLEATSFRQLQLVMEKLDLRTKLCIRDSLYRLARSAEQRHNNANQGGGSGGDNDASQALIAEGTNKCPAFVDVETDTNPIDRSIAHLLFHRPSDSPVMTAYDASSVKSYTMIHGSINKSPVMDEMVYQEETAGETDRNVADH